MAGSRLLFVLAALLAAAGASIVAGGKTSIHELEGGVVLVLAGLLLVAALLVAIEARLARLLALLAELDREAAHRDEAHRDEARRELAAQAATLRNTLKELAATIRRNRPAAPLRDPLLPLRLQCSACGKTVTAPHDWAGRAGKCPACSAAIEFPAALRHDRQL